MAQNRRVKKKINKKKPLKLKKVKKKVKVSRRKKVQRKTIGRKKKASGRLRKRTSPVERFHGNPIITPRSDRPWESKATFNPGAVRIGDKVHLLYRAIGDSDMSVLGHASSLDGITIDERSESPSFISPDALGRSGTRELFVGYSSGGGGWGGVEDPRITNIDGRLYVTYTSFNGWEAPRVALTSIAVNNFLNKKWNWEKPLFLSPPNEIHKNWVIFPEKINGKYALLHSLSPIIRVDYFDDLNFDGSSFIESKHNSEPRKGVWDMRVRGVGAPPIKTKDGWLVFYHATDDRDPGRYKLGAMLLDLDDPSKILYRSAEPILAPDEEYENAGYKWGVIYSCGAVVIDNVLFLYYGGADYVACVATADINEFLGELKRTGKPKVKKASVRSTN